MSFVCRLRRSFADFGPQPLVIVMTAEATGMNPVRAMTITETPILAVLVTTDARLVIPVTPIPVATHTTIALPPVRIMAGLMRGIRQSPFDEWRTCDSCLCSRGPPAGGRGDRYGGPPPDRYGGPPDRGGYADRGPSDRYSSGGPPPRDDGYSGLFFARLSLPTFSLN